MTSSSQWVVARGESRARRICHDGGVPRPGRVSAWPAGRRSVSTTQARTTTTSAEETARKLRTHKKDAEAEEQTRQNLDQGPKHGDDRGPRYTARSFVNEVMATGSSA